MMWNGINIDSTFKMDVEIERVSDNSFFGNALDSSFISGQRLPPGGYRGITATYRRVQIGFWTYRMGYHVSQRMCTTQGTCLTQLLMKENQNKMMIYGKLAGITAWVETKSGARPMAAVSRAGNRGTGLAPGNWTWGGGMMWNGINIDSTFKMDVEIERVSDNSFFGNALDSSFISGQRLPPGGYRGITATYRRVQIGFWTYRMGYHVSQRMCTTQGTCLTQLLMKENQNKMMIYGKLAGITAWVETKSGARPMAAALLAETGV